ncbi:hypothetical protein XENOCAPTIV_011816 [Xenoophorus captivus]|uniref:Uncharacterized protein n=1 Tax=Xenoophorus captivus TaxID=1517983 RepID=A0ABV0Q9H8_9TELE
MLAGSAGKMFHSPAAAAVSYHPVTSFSATVGKSCIVGETSPQHSLQLSLNSPGRQKTCTYLLGGRLAAESSTPARRSPEDPCLSALTETISDQSWTKTV